MPLFTKSFQSVTFVSIFTVKIKVCTTYHFSVIFDTAVYRAHHNWCTYHSLVSYTYYTTLFIRLEKSTYFIRKICRYIYSHQIFVHYHTITYLFFIHRQSFIKDKLQVKTKINIFTDICFLGFISWTTVVVHNRDHPGNLQNTLI